MIFFSSFSLHGQISLGNQPAKATESANQGNLPDRFTEPGFVDPLGLTISVTHVSCFSGTDGTLTANATGGSAPYTYLWSTGGTEITESGLGQGNYSVTVTDSEGASLTEFAAVFQPPALVSDITIDNPITVNRQFEGQITATASGGTPGYAYLWSNGSIDATQMRLPAGTYTVSITDANNCTSVSSILLTEPPNTSPVFTSSPVETVSDNEIYSYQVTASDVERDFITVE
ncbi:MAG: hypothetical protein HEP71_33640, partial [Roseivirga sp.]|nr:hypothetical protein [Roseivirga sp.]